MFEDYYDVIPPRWDNAPEWSYKGYLYNPEIDDDTDGFHKVWHNVVKRIEPNRVVFTTNHTPYKYMNEQQFKDFINQMEILTDDGR